MGEVCVSNRACGFCECVSGYECTGRYFKGALEVFITKDGALQRWSVLL